MAQRMNHDNFGVSKAKKGKADLVKAIPEPPDKKPVMPSVRASKPGKPYSGP